MKDYEKDLVVLRCEMILNYSLNDIDDYLKKMSVDDEISVKVYQLISMLRAIKKHREGEVIE